MSCYGHRRYDNGFSFEYPASGPCSLAFAVLWLCVHARAGGGTTRESFSSVTIAPTTKWLQRRPLLPCTTTKTGRNGTRAFPRKSPVTVSDVTLTGVRASSALAGPAFPSGEVAVSEAVRCRRYLGARSFLKGNSRPIQGAASTEYAMRCRWPERAIVALADPEMGKTKENGQNNAEPRLINPNEN